MLTQLFNLLLIMMILTSLMFSLFNHPISLGFMLVLYTLFLSVSLLFYSSSSWFTLLISIMFIGGTLILFIYVISLISNILIEKKMSLISLLFLTLSLSLFIYMEISIENEPMMQFNQFSQLKVLKFLIFLFSTSYYKISIFLVGYLFLAMIVVLKIVNIKKNFFKF